SISHGSIYIKDGLAQLMATQLCLRQREFRNLVDCSLSEEDWDGLIRQRCLGGRNPFLRR
ncbi:MAG: hypothetical protein M3217_12020, partial [Actinomycetota bacterium]|nr:hypothetical protein [Actinomycetota bacterium]